MIKIDENLTVTSPAGFKASGIHCGLKKSLLKKDLALIYSDVVATSCGVYTKNKVKGAPLTVTKQHLINKKAQAIIINSGNANTCNGDDGLSKANKMTRLCAKALNIVGNCEKDTDCPEGTCRSVCEIRVENNTQTLNDFSGEFVFTPSDKGEIVSVTPGDGWTNNTGNSANFMFTSTEGISDASFDLATVVLEVEEGVTGCTLTVSNPSVGGEIDIEITTETEVNTGATLPIAILACGIGAVAVIYVVSKKNKKLYKI